MTDIPVKRLPFKIVSSSVQSGYTNYLSSNFKQGIDITNLHKDSYGDPNIPNLQSQFTNQHVGGDQHRHIPLNLGNDNDYSRPELFKISAISSSLRVYGADYEDVNKPRAFYWRGTKSPINIANIKNSGNIAGNYSKTYEVVQTVGRSYANNLLSSGFLASGNLSTQFITGVNNYSLPDVTRYTEDNVQYKNNSVFVQRFNSPGGKQESSRGSLDRFSEEFSPNNSLTTRNISVRQPFYNQLTQHSPRFNSGSTSDILPATGSVNAISIHAVNRNTSRVLGYDSNMNVVKSNKYDNYWVQRSIPQDNFGYAWITASSISDPYTNGSNTIQFQMTSSIGTNFEINLQTQTLLNILSSSNSFYSTWKQIRTGEHPVARKLKELNYLSIKDKPVSTIDSRGVARVTSTGLTTNYKEPPITSKHFPIEQSVIFGNSTTPIKLRYTFKNTVDNFANKSINNQLSLIDKKSKFYDNIVRSKNSQNSPITDIVSLDYKENIFPKAENTYLSGTRSRTQYILNQTGFERDGYDRQLGTQRVFWRDNQQNRRRSANSLGGYINSLGYSSLEESGSNFIQDDNGILFDNSFINHSATLTQNFVNLDKGINNSFVLLESGSSERELYTYTGSFKGTFYNNGNTADKVHADIVKRGYTLDVAGEFNNSFVDFYEQFVKKNKKQSIGAIYRNTSYKQMNNCLPVSRENLPDVFSRTDDESVFVNPKPRYVAFVGGGELNTGSVFDNSANFTDEYFNTYISGANQVINKILSVGNKIYFGGSFTQIGEASIDYIAVYDKRTQKFSQLGTSSFNNSVLDIAISGSYIIAGGFFTTPFKRMAKYNTLTNEWSGFGGGLGAGSEFVKTILVSGSDVYAGGNWSANTGSCVAKWDGTNWSSVGSGFDSNVNKLILSGSDIYAAGNFTTTGSRVAKWDGTNWSAVGGGLSGSVSTLILSGNDIYAGGNWSANTGSRVAKWDGTNWSALSTGLPYRIDALLISGTDIYAGGVFGTFSKWNGVTWTNIPNSINATLTNMILSDSSIYIAGNFTSPYKRLISYSTDTNEFSLFNTSTKYDNFSKNVLNTSLNSSDVKFSTLDNGLINQKIKPPTYDSSEDYSQSDIYQIGKDFSILPEFRMSEHIRYYMSESAGNFTTINNDFLEIDGVGQDYKSANSKNSNFDNNFLEKYSFTEKFNLQSIQDDYRQELEQEKITLTVSGIKKLIPYNGFYPQERTIQLANLYNDYVDNFISGGVYNLNNINDYYNNRILSGNFYSSSADYVEDSTNIDIEKFLNKYYLLNEEQESWAIKPAFGSSETSYITSFLVSGSDLYIAGRFDSVANIPFNRNLAKYSLINKTWSKISILPASSWGSTFTFNCLALSGNYIYVGGYFQASSVYKNVAVYDTINDSWSPLGLGLGAASDEVKTILISGSDVYAGGTFTTSGNYISKWDGTNWNSIGATFNAYIASLILSGSDIYIGGNFTTPHRRVSVYSPSLATFNSVSGGLENTVYTLVLSGSDIYAGGSWVADTGSRVAKWDGTNWSAVGGGLSSIVRTLYVSGNDIYAGGDWTTNTGSYIAKWNGSTWTGLNTGLNNSVNTIFVSGNDIYAGGYFNNSYCQRFGIADINYNIFNSYPKNKSYIYSSNGNTYKNFNQTPVLSLSSSDYSNGRLISASNGLNLFSFKYNEYPSSTNKILHNSISTDGDNWSEPLPIIQPLHANDQFGEYFDYLYENNELSEKILFAISSTTVATGSKTAAGAVSFVSATLKLASDDSGIKYWEYSNKVTLGTGSADYNRFGTGLSMISCSSGYQVFMGEIYGDITSVNYGNIWVTTSSNGNTWSQPISILSGTVPNSSLGFNNIKAVNFEKDGISRSYLFFAEPLSSGSSNVIGKFFVISSSINNNWGTTNINSQKTELYSVLPSTSTSGTLLDTSGSNKYSIEAYSSNNFITYCFVNSAEDDEEKSEILIGNSYDGINWQTGEKMFRQVNSVAKGCDIVGLSTYEVSGNTLPVFFTNISSSSGVNSIYAIHNNQYTQFTLNVSGVEKYVKQAALEPIMAPGILYNTIKSGIAVDWPCSTGSQTSIQPYGSGTIVNAYYPQSFKMAKHKGANINELNMYGSLKSNIDYRVNFEKLIFPEQIFLSKQRLTASLTETTTLTSLPSESELVQFISGCYVYGGYEPYISPVDVSDYNQLGPKRFSVPFVYKKAESSDNGLYSMAMSNFLAETVKFFLTGGLLTSFKSRVDSEWSVFEGNKKYYMDIAIFKSNNLVMMEAYHSDKHPVGPKGQKMNGRYFGYPVNKTNKKLWSKESDELFTQTEAKLIHNDPAYAPYTPPYFEGEAIARVYFQPTASNKYSLDQVLSGLVVENIFPGVLDGAHINSDAYLNKMPIEASLNIRGKVSSGEVTNNTTTGERQERNDGTKNSWVISTKFETPVLDFSNQSSIFYENNYSKKSGYGRGMWSGYGNIPSPTQNIQVELRESPQGLVGGQKSLLQQVGFQQNNSKKIGVLYGDREKSIKEAIMIIPFVDGQNSMLNRRNAYFGTSLPLNDIERRLGKTFISINYEKYQNIIRNKINSSILDTYNKMQKYIIPPELDYILNPSVSPYVAYIIEFEHKFLKQELADIWQGVSPRIANVAELDQIELIQNNSENDFYHGLGIPNNVRFMIFKIKQKGEFNYFKVTEDSSDDQNFRFNQKIGNVDKTNIYSYNWPYDYCSLVELAKVDLKVSYKKKVL